MKRKGEIWRPYLEFLLSINKITQAPSLLCGYIVTHVTFAESVTNTVTFLIWRSSVNQSQRTSNIRSRTWYHVYHLQYFDEDDLNSESCGFFFLVLTLIAATRYFVTEWNRSKVKHVVVMRHYGCGGVAASLVALPPVCESCSLELDIPHWLDIRNFKAVRRSLLSSLT